ncbi:MAG: Stp1/IreP family PP2C-type Ser/Thr phosphatase [Anaerolineae bacterium]|jgi:serine/threonine protein phosphatase PrpC
MKCPECGRMNRVAAGYCAWCGHHLASEKDVRPGKEAAREPFDAGDDLPLDEGNPDAIEAETSGDVDIEEPFGAGPTGDEDGEEAAPAPPFDEGEPVSVEAEKAPDDETLGAPSGDEGAMDQEQESGALGVGDILAGHYEIVELLEEGEAVNRYRARDLALCASCGYDDNPPGSDFCASCGAALDVAFYVTVVEQVQRPPRHYDVHFEEKERDYYITVEPLPEVEGEGDDGAEAHGPIRLIWGYATDQGLQRDHNEDYADARLYTRSTGEVLGLFVVADGLGGQDSGEVASQMATEAVWESLRETVWERLLRGESLGDDELEARLVEAVAAANRVVYETRVERDSDMSTTLTLAMIVDDTAYVGNVGDSRTYLWNAGGLQHITRDHSLVQRLVDAGQLSADEVYTHPRRNVIYQSIGDRHDVNVDVFRHRLAVDDRLILCSDGLWEMVRDEGMEEVLLSEPDPQRAADRLVQNANLAGGEDNITVIVVQAIPGR